MKTRLKVERMTLAMESLRLRAKDMANHPAGAARESQAMRIRHEPTIAMTAIAVTMLLHNDSTTAMMRRKI
jgi:hypothetical protein